MNEWERELTDLEERALCSFVLDSDNDCEKIAQKDYTSYCGGEGLSQTLYRYTRTKECVLIIRQKGYIVNTLHIKPEEMEDFLKKWDKGELFPYGNREHLNKEDKSKITPLQQKEANLSSLEAEARKYDEELKTMDNSDRQDIGEE